MVTLIAQIAAALGLVLACSWLHGWWLAASGAAPLALELWLTALPALAVRSLLPSAAGAVLVVALVLAVQHFLLVRLLAAAFGYLRRPAGLSRRRRRPAAGTALR